jgi:ketosteroid isomerase-like protein
MNKDEKRALIERYLCAYNTFDIDGMLSEIHENVEFKNISGGEVNATATGKEELRQLAEQAKGLFLSRKQTATHFESFDDQASIDVDYIGVLAIDLPNGLKKGETLKLSGRSEFSFRDGKIYKITDIS